MGKFKFGVNLWGAENREDWVAKCRRVEALGFDVISVPDHLGPGRNAPFPALTMAAAVTQRPRVGTLVSNMAFYNAALFAREVVTTAKMTGDRLDLGLGSGHMKSEFDDAGLPWIPAKERIEYLAKSLDHLRGHFADEGITPPPLLLAGNSDGVLSLAAREADIAGFAGLRQAPGKPPGTFRLDDAERMDERVAFFRSQANGRDPELNMLVQRVVVADDRRAAAEAWREEVKDQDGLDVDALLETPQLLFGTVAEIVRQLQERRERYGFSYITVFEPMLETFAPVVRELSGQ
ncbi:probable F420-dependent oxidoreductase, MSMEG_2516 family [Amycolatopsis lurida]|uniref:5,10-methylene tetrahydromethanopterin reductase n=1 Tax=Amycolatopsis lurida NRRL 2430 TaxID=1460371 RepID=A0A2P2G1C6_AMYLU|nr:TIGR03621 family F420-dependent LLM class oxidoreductase [Amycolatopsis lurida]KFU82768.1 5,10-methylene tetrahydromethanopterin reductase [Amycolatopsis lurida NRRL 2430]SEE03482.1 probable F420-dependent oxidoreductase, MSMEG_2516 family [Amycolatopsis lurida]